MSRRINHSRSIVKGDYYRNTPTSSSPDTCDKISDIQLGIRIFSTIQRSVQRTQKVFCPRRRKKALGKQLGSVLLSCLHRLPRAMVLSQKALEDQIAALKEAFRKEPLAEAPKATFLEKDQSKTDN